MALTPWAHRDLFDQMIVAVAQAGGLPLVAPDAALGAAGVQRIWT